MLPNYLWHSIKSVSHTFLLWLRLLSNSLWHGVKRKDLFLFMAIIEVALHHKYCLLIEINRDHHTTAHELRLICVDLKFGVYKCKMYPMSSYFFVYLRSCFSMFYLAKKKYRELRGGIKYKYKYEFNINFQCHLWQSRKQLFLELESKETQAHRTLIYILDKLISIQSHM